MPAQSQQSINVALGTRAYDIVIEGGLLARAGVLIGKIRPQGNVFIVTDETVNDLHGKALLNALPKARAVIAVSAGETSKDFVHLAMLANKLVAAGITRNDVVVAFGGGVVGDLAGFAASIVLRGVDFVQVPTTLLAQVDSSVGGKTGINLPAGKNLVGSFHQPRLVLVDPDLLDTLPARQMRAGYAEIVKMALIGDEKFFNWLEKNGAAVFENTPQRAQAIAAACRMKADIVARDELERGERMLLNLGHTFGHALEALTGYGDALLHGEAVAIGTAMAFRLSARLELCEAADARRAAEHLSRAGLPVSLQGLPGIDAESLLNTMFKDKKMTGAQITLILARGIGKAFVSRDVAAEDLAAFLNSEVK